MSYPFAYPSPWPNPFDAGFYNLQSPYNAQSPYHFPPAYNVQPPYQPGFLTEIGRQRQEMKYLEDQLSKTAVLLGTLRSKQLKNERTLGADPKPRSKKKKIQQNRWRTDKTIKTFEYDERVIWDKLLVCNNNIMTLEFQAGLMDLSMRTPSLSFSSSQGSCPPSASTEHSWNGWIDDSALSPSLNQNQKPIIIADEVPPEIYLNDTALENKISEQYKSADVMATEVIAPGTVEVLHAPGSMLCHSTLSPEAAVFQPSTTHNIHEETLEARGNDSVCYTDSTGAPNKHGGLKRCVSLETIGSLVGSMGDPAPGSPVPTKTCCTPSPEYIIPSRGRTRARAMSL